MSRPRPARPPRSADGSCHTTGASARDGSHRPAGTGRNDGASGSSPRRPAGQVVMLPRSRYTARPHRAAESPPRTVPGTAAPSCSSSVSAKGVYPEISGPGARRAAPVFPVHGPGCRVRSGSRFARSTAARVGSRPSIASLSSRRSGRTPRGSRPARAVAPRAKAGTGGRRSVYGTRPRPARPDPRLSPQAVKTDPPSAPSRLK